MYSRAWRIVGGSSKTKSAEGGLAAPVPDLPLGRLQTQEEIKKESKCATRTLKGAQAFARLPRHAIVLSQDNGSDWHCDLHDGYQLKATEGVPQCTCHVATAGCPYFQHSCSDTYDYLPHRSGYPA